MAEHLENIQTEVEISELEFPECVRIRHGMYISSTEQMITEIVDNAVDEFCAGNCSSIAVTITDDEIIIEDNGGGISIQPSTKDPNKSQAEIAYTKLHAGGKFGLSNGYKVKTGGLHGVGASCVNALSEYCILNIKTRGKKYQLKFEKGITVQKLTEIETGLDLDNTGTTVKFKLDKDIWKDEKPNIKKIKRRLEQLTYLNPGLIIGFKVNTNSDQIEEIYYHKNGIEEYLQKLISKNTTITKPFVITSTINDVDVAIGFCYVDNFIEEIYGFCNNINTPDGGDHINGFKSGLSSAINNYIKNHNVNFSFKQADLNEGIVSIIAIKIKDPVFEGQSKTKLKMTEVRATIKEMIEKAYYDYLDKNPDEFKNIKDKINIAIKARTAASNARMTNKIQKKMEDTSKLSAKLAKCRCKDPNKCEIYLVEGESAGGTAKQARDREFQAILPVFGKIMNVQKKRFNQVLTSEKIRLIVQSIKTGIGDKFNLDNIRYKKIIIMSDADVDGDHIKLLYMTLFYRYFRPIVEAGYIYWAKPPLFKIWKGKKIKYAFSDAEKDMIYQNDFNSDAQIQRFKGLGEMNADQLWETTMNPKTRTLIKITIQDLEEAEQMLSITMGEDVTPRKKFIMDNIDFSELD